MSIEIVRVALIVVINIDADTEDRERAALSAWNGLSPVQKKCLQQLLFKGPVWDAALGMHGVERTAHEIASVIADQSVPPQERLGTGS